MFNNFTEKWDLRFLDIAKTVSTWSKDPSTGCGAVIVRPNRSIVSSGYNGLPNTIMSGYESSLLEDREKKYQIINHAEINAVLFAKGNLKNCCVYTYPLFSCSRCASMLLQAGIKRFVSIKLDESSDKYDRWKDSWELSNELFRLSDVEVKYYDFF
jgi:dCMP deaminase